MSYKKNLALLCLYFAKGVGPVYQRRLLEKFGNLIEEIFLEKNFSELAQALSGDFPISLLKNIYEDSNLRRAEKELEWLEKNQSKIITILDADYPPLLKNIHNPPALLFSRGNFSSWTDFLPIAFVGTREITDYGKKVISHLIESLEETNVVVVSGFAKGVDAYTHKAALKAHLPTIGVLGTGLDYIYPRENEELYYEMIEQGGFLTEYPTGTMPHPGHFPDRNRIVSGISKGVIVIEAPEESGALITARYALEQNREVMAVPGNIFSQNSRGSHRLIQQGAKLIEKIEDVLEEFQLIQKNIDKISSSEKNEIPLDETEKILFENLSSEPQHIDKIFEICTLPPSLIAGTLTTLVLKGVVNELPGKFFVKSESF